MSPASRDGANGRFWRALLVGRPYCGLTATMTESSVLEADDGVAVYRLEAYRAAGGYEMPKVDVRPHYFRWSAI
jgi:hypothetical protein